MKSGQWAARSLEINALKTESRAIYANCRNIAQNLSHLQPISSLTIPEIFTQKHYACFEDIEDFVGDRRTLYAHWVGALAYAVR